MKTLNVVPMGTLHFCNTDANEPTFLSAGSGVVWVDRRLYVVADDHGSVGEFNLDWQTLQTALRGESVPELEPGISQRILPGAYEPDAKLRKKGKADFEALTVIRPRDIEKVADVDELGNDVSAIKQELLRRFPNGLLMVAGSGGMKKGKRKRSKAVVYSLDESGHLTGLPTKISLEPLHNFLDANHVIGELNIEGITVRDNEIIFAQRGNSLAPDGTPAPSMLIHLSMLEVLRSLYTDLEIGECEVRKVEEFAIGELSVTCEGVEQPVKLDFTDIDAVAHDPLGRMVFSAAAEVSEGPLKGEIAGSVVGIISAAGEITQTFAFPEVIKIEGVNAEYNHVLGEIDLLLVSDADDPEVPAPLLAARVCC